MHSFAFVALFSIVFCSAEECDSDDVLLLQTRTVKRAVRSRKLPEVHRYQIIAEDGMVSLLQGHGAVSALSKSKGNATVWTLCAADNDGNAEEYEDEYGTQVDTGGYMHVYNEAGYVGDVVGFSNTSMHADECAAFAEGPGWYDSLTNSSLSTLRLVNASDISDVLLIQVPVLPPALQSAAQDIIRKTMQNSPHSGVILYGSGAKFTPQFWAEFNAMILRILRALDRQLSSTATPSSPQQAAAPQATAPYHSGGGSADIPGLDHPGINQHTTRDVWDAGTHIG